MNCVSWSWLTITAKSWPDRRAIVARLSHDCGKITVQFRPRSPLIDGPRSSCDRGHQIHLLTGSNGPQIARKFSFKKTNVLPCFFLTLDWFGKQLNEFGEKFWVIHDPSAFRLDFNQIGPGLITNFHRISSNFSLQRRTSARKKSSKIRFNSSELKPQICGNQVSSGIQLIIRW